jgi:Xaa-Pro dipeptidase
MSRQIDQLYPDHLTHVRDAHDRALAATGYERVAIFAGAERMAFLDDNSYPFRVNPHFKWWAPILDNPNCFVVYTPGSRPVLIYYQPVDYWYKPAEDPTGVWVDHFDIRMIATPGDAKQHLAGGGRTAFIGETSPAFEDWGFAATNPEDLVNRLHFARTEKTEYEIACIRAANVIAARAHLAAEKAFRKGRSEYEIHLAYLEEAAHNERELPYGNIVAVNESGAVLHYQHQSRQRLKKKKRHSFLLDAGATVNGYASDITRTWTRDGGEFQELIDAVDEFQQDLCAMVRPGLDYKEVHMAAHRKVGATLKDFGIVDVDGDAAFEKGITSTFFPHGIGHYLGLQVHDVAGFMADESGRTIPKPEGHPYLRLTRVVEENHVFTIEPGIYFIDSLLRTLQDSENARHVNWDKVDGFRKFGGVRIEDDIVVRPGGSENLTRPAFEEAS